MSFHSPKLGYCNWQDDLAEATFSMGLPTPSPSEKKRSQPIVNPLAGYSQAEKGVSHSYSSPPLPEVYRKASRPCSTLKPNLETDLPIAQPSICFTLDAAGNILAITPSGAVQMGYEPEMLIGQPVTNLFRPQDYDRLQSALAGSFATGSANPETFQVVCQDRNGLPLNVTFQSLQTHTETIVLLVCTICQRSEFIAPSEQLQAQQLLRQQTEWESLLRAITQPGSQSLGLRAILRTVAAEVQRSLKADRVLIYQAHPRKAGSVLAEALTIGCPSVFRQPRVATLFQQRYIQQQFNNSTGSLEEIYQTHQTVDRSTDALLQRLGVQSELVVPILQQGKLWGLLIVHQCSRSRQWQGWETGLLKQVGTYLDSAIHQAELYQKVQRLNANLERQIQARTAELRLASEFEATLKRITDKVRDSLDERQILETAVQELVCAIGISGCNASIYDLDAGISTIFYEYTTNLSPYQGRIVYLDASPELYSQLLDGQTFQFCSLMVNPTRGKVAMLTCPLVDDQGVLGDLWLINQPYYCFTEQDIRLVRQVANQCAIAIRQARLYQAAQAQVEELGRLNQLKDDFLSTVSHELRTPMANIKMATQMLEVNLKQGGLLGDDISRVSKYFQILQAECQREINLINDLLDLSRLDTEHPSPELVTFDLNTWLPAIVRPFLERAESQQQQFILDLSEPIPPVIADLISLERILAELLQNACKYTPSGETITLSAQFVKPQGSGARGQGSVGRSQERDVDFPSSHPQILTPSPTRSLTLHTSNLLRLCVTNSGVEIPAHEVEQIFEKFYRIPSSDRWQHGGTGLGLALVRKLAEHLGGTVWAESNAGQTQFIVELPLPNEGDEPS